MILEREATGDRGYRGQSGFGDGRAIGVARVTAQVSAIEGAKAVLTTDANAAGAEETVRLIVEPGRQTTFVGCEF